MKYEYSKVSEVEVSMSLTANDMERLIKILKETNSEENQWFRKNAIEKFESATKALGHQMEIEGRNLVEIMEKRNAEANDRDDGQQRIPNSVPHNHRHPGEALSRCRAHVILIQRFQRGAAHDSGEDGQLLC